MKAWIGNLRLAYKFLLIGALTAFMLLLLAGLIVHNEVAVLRAAEREVLGLEPTRDALRLLQLTQQHRGLAAGLLGGNDSLKEPRAAKQAEVDTAMVIAIASAARLGDPEIDASLNAIGETWKALAADVTHQSIPGPVSFARHTALTAAELSLIQDIANSSGIVLHPEASGYFLQAAVLDTLPRLTESLGQIRARGTLLLAKGEATPEDRARIEALVGTTQARFEDTSSGR